MLKCQQCGFQTHAGVFYFISNKIHYLVSSCRNGWCYFRVSRPRNLDMRTLSEREIARVLSRTSKSNIHGSTLLIHVYQNSDCVLCPRTVRDKEKKDEIYPPSDTFLRAEKPTEGQSWVHVLCSVFIPEVAFSDVHRLRLVEGISVINPHRWSTVRCSLLLAINVS